MMARLSLRVLGKVSLLDVAVAALAAGSVTFIVYALPDWRFTRLVLDSGLPAILDAAQPPLGRTARLAAMILAGTLCFVAVAALMRALDKVSPSRLSMPRVALPKVSLPKMSLPKRRPAVEEFRGDVPRLRRGDAHPDAPPRPPILAGLDLGEPWPTDLADTGAAAPRDVADDESPFEDIPHLEAVQSADEEPLDLSDAFAEEAVSGPVVDDAIAALFRPRETEAEVAPDAPVEPAGTTGFTLPEARGESVAALMQRLEGGLALKQHAPQAEPVVSDQIQADPTPAVQAPTEQISVQPVASEQAPVEPVPTGHRLRSAINELERIAKRT